MDAVPSPRHAGLVAGLCAVALVCTAALLLVPPGSDARRGRSQRHRRGRVHRRRDRRSPPARRRRPGRACAPSPSPSCWSAPSAAAFAIAGSGHRLGYAPARGRRRAARRCSCRSSSRRATSSPRISRGAIDARSPPTSCCSPLSLAAIAYVAAPSRRERRTQAAVSAATFALLAAARHRDLRRARAVVPDARPPAGLHRVRAAVPRDPRGSASHGYARRTTEAPPGSASRSPWSRSRSRASTCWCHTRRSALRADGSTRIARPVLTSITVMTACAALSIVAILDDARGIAGAALDGAPAAPARLAIAVRVLTNQLASAEAFDAGAGRAGQAAGRAGGHGCRARSACARPTNRCADPRSTCASSSTPRSTGSWSSTTEARSCGPTTPSPRMVSLDPSAIHGMSWTAVAAAIDGADPAFARLLDGGQATINRSDGQHAAPGGDRLGDPDRPAADPACSSATSAPRRWPIRRSGRCSSSCRTATRTARACCADRTPRSSRSATASRAICTTGPSKGCRRRRCPWRRPC